MLCWRGCILEDLDQTWLSQGGSELSLSANLCAASFLHPQGPTVFLMSPTKMQCHSCQCENAQANMTVSEADSAGLYLLRSSRQHEKVLHRHKFQYHWQRVLWLAALNCDPLYQSACNQLADACPASSAGAACAHQLQLPMLG